MSLAPAHVATVAGHPIALSVLEERTARIRRGPRGRHVPPEGGDEWRRFRRWIVQELVTEAVLAHEARAAGLAGPTAPPSPAAIRGLFERVTTGVMVPREEIRVYYERNADLFRRREARVIREILLPEGADARSAAATHALSRADVIELHRGECTGALEDAVFAADVGEVVGPIATEHGWHVVRVESVVPEERLPFTEVRQAIEAELLAAARARVFGAWLEQRRQALAVVEPAYEHPSHPIHGMPRHRH